MAVLPDYALGPRDDDEGLFSRDINGQLVRLDAPTEADYSKRVTVQVDGREVIVPLAEPLKDSQGNIVLDLEGRTTPRYTTIFDAIVAMRRSSDASDIAVPTLCHQPHMTPVGVCRMCVVQVYGLRHGKRTPERKLLPACQHQVKDGMEVFTMNHPGADGQRVRKTVEILAELLTTDHLKMAPPPAPADELAPYNELRQLAERLGIRQSRFAIDVLAESAVSRPPGDHTAVDDSSPVFLVDHSACILCDRCWRSCNEVKSNHIMGRTGKGWSTAVGFDLDDRMFESGCVQCGECMVSCPTSAITFKPIGSVQIKSEGEAPEVIPLSELKQDELFSVVPAKFLLWQQGLVLRRRLHAGDVLCRQAEPGNSAFLLKRGDFEVTIWPTEERVEKDGRHVKRVERLKPLRRERRSYTDVILGEMACLTGMTRAADVVALADAEVWELRRNVLDRMMRSPAHRDLFERLYCERALPAALDSSELFAGLEDEERQQCSEFIGPHLEFVRVSPEQTIFRQGDRADYLYLIRLGHVRVASRRNGYGESLFCLGPGTVFGEAAMLSISNGHASQSVDEVSNDLGDILNRAQGHLSGSLAAGRRSATCSALDHLELARLNRESVLEMIREFPKLRRNLISIALARMNNGHAPLMKEYLERGLYQGQSLLVMDLNKCTRCDDCIRACIEQHGTTSHGYELTRLVRVGERFGDFLVPHSCRSCKDANCMRGCPVDAIHRGKHLQIVIEDHCIGCRLCERNCPYDNISMLENKVAPLARLKAATCDLCDAEGREDTVIPRCVYMCPHDAARRTTGQSLFNLVQGISHKL